MDSCSPSSNASLNAYRVYSLVVPAAVLLLIAEGVYIFMKLPSNFGTSSTVHGALPQIPKGLMPK